MQKLVRRILGICDDDAPVLGHYRNEMNGIPVSERGVPERSCFTRSAAHYAEMHQTALSLLDASPPAEKPDLELVHQCRCIAQWGLIYSGIEAIDYAVAMLRSKIPEVREDGAAILSEIGGDEKVVSELIQAFDTELEQVVEPSAEGMHLETLDSMIMTLGALKSKLAIPSLARLLQAEAADIDSRHLAAESLGKIVRRRFDKKVDPIAEALNWLKSHPDYNIA